MAPSATIQDLQSSTESPLTLNLNTVKPKVKRQIEIEGPDSDAKAGSPNAPQNLSTEH
jgi:hypothetical protein